MMITQQRKNSPLRTFGSQFCLTIAFAGTQLMGGPAAVASAESSPVIEQRAILLEATAGQGVESIPLLLESLDNPNRAVRMTAAHLLVSLPNLSDTVLQQALASEDERVRSLIFDRIAADGKLMDYLTVVLEDESPMIGRRFTLVYVPEYFLADDGTLRLDVVDRLQAIYESAPQPVRHQIAVVVTDYPPTDRSRAFIDAISADARGGIAAIAAEAIIDELNQLVRAREWRTIIDEYAETDVDGWPDELAYGLHYALGFAHYNLRDGEAAERELATALEFRQDRRALLAAARNYRVRLNDPERAVQFYVDAVNADLGARASLLYGACLEGAALLRSAGRYDEALALLEPGLNDARGTWSIRMQLARAETLAAMGDRETARAAYQSLLDSGELSDGQVESVKSAIGEL